MREARAAQDRRWIAHVRDAELHETTLLQMALYDAPIHGFFHPDDVPYIVDDLPLTTNDRVFHQEHAR
jgi:hypothetical protein